MSIYHVPVLLNEVIDFLQPSSGKKYIDATIGGGGHTEGVLKAGGQVLGIDQDEEALEEVKIRLKDWIKTGQLIIQNGNFKNLEEIAKNKSFTNVDGILFDLGVSTHQLETPERGFSFNSDAPLDMRMDKSLKITAADLVNGLNKGELYELFTKLGEEHYARPISQAIVRARSVKQITKCNELANIILSVRRRGKFDRTHPATRVFQALRIAVNDELNSLTKVLPQTVKVVGKNGKILVISFHSLEDRIIKKFFKTYEKEGKVKTLTDKPTIPSNGEVRMNPKARSAKLRVAVRL